MVSQAHKPLLEFYNLPDGRMPEYAMMFAYPQYMPEFIHARNPVQVTWR
jgi:hypothetical protein